jgi:tetratricopeptide (TPR) repeat protein
MTSSFDSWRKRVFPDTALALIGAAVFLISVIVYLLTVQRSVSFWDCGEFVACSYILGVPHPPGTPLFILIGRIFSILPLVSDISFRVNLISPISGALAATMAYFVLARLITLWSSDRYPDLSLSLPERLSVYAGSFAGALLFAFGSTNWSNAVEAEVYSLAMFLMMTLIWLTLLWASRRDDPASDRYLIAISYLAFLAIGIHMTVFLVMPPIFLTIALLSERLRRDWRFWVTGVILALVMAGVMNFLWSVSVWLLICGVGAAYRRWGIVGIVWSAVVIGAGIVWSLTRDEYWPLFIATFIWGLGIVPWTQQNTRWRLSFALILVALLGYSTHLFIPIRANQNPAINENDPKTWAAFRGFLERKQYGSESMFQRALNRRGEWSNQFGQHRRMGFWGFFDRQYGFNDRAFTPLFLLGLIGVFQLLRRRRILGALFLMLLLISSAGLVWYMNFADGTRYNAAIQDAYLEVRNRDYFFTPAFVLFGMAIGLGGAALIRWLAGGTERNSVVWPLIGALIVAALPIRTLSANFHESDRSNNYLPYDYAHNILASADKDALLFTNGDNDTFPVWCLQEVYGVRRDVRVVNLSLLNTHWYIKQMKHMHNVPIDLTDAEIDRLIHYRTADGTVHRVQDQMINVILSSNKGKYPVNFAVTVTPPNRRYRGESIENHLEMAGMAYRLVPEEGEEMVAVDLLKDRLLNKYQFRGVNDSTVFKNETARRMVTNYASGFFVMADTLRRAGELEEAETYVRKALDLFPDQWETYVYLAQLYQDMKRPDMLDSLLVWSRAVPIDRERVVLNVAYSFRRLGQMDRAEEIISALYDEMPDNQQVLRALAQLYYDTQRYDTLLLVVEDWMNGHPEDKEMERLLFQVRNLTTPPIDEQGGSDTVSDTVSG